METARGPFRARLSVVFGMMLSVALLPIGVFAVAQTRNLIHEVASAAEAARLGATLRAADEEVSVILRARGMMAGLAQVIGPVIDNLDACQAMARQFAAAEPRATLVAFVPRSGLVTCTSTGTSVDLSQSPLFAEVRGAETPYFIVNRHGPISKTSVLGISHPVLDATGQYLGYVSISLPHSVLNDLRENSDLFSSYNGGLVSFWMFDRDGSVLTSSDGLDMAEQHLPVIHALKGLVGTNGEVFNDKTAQGIQQSYAVVPIVPGELYLMSNWQPLGGQLSGLRAYLPVAMMWLAALIVAVAASELLVTRHVRLLNNGFGAFARGDRRMLDIDLARAPMELRALGDAYLSMTEAIIHGEARMEDSLHQKEVLLREVHHRVKNNLQLIASIMNIQMRKAVSPEAKSLLKGLQDRVMSLATTHRGLYMTSGMADVHVGELFTDIVRQITAMSAGGENRCAITTDLDDIRMVPDQAVPLSLLMTEALTNAIKHSGGTETVPGQIGLRLKRKGDSEAVMEVYNSYATSATALPGSFVQDAMNTGLGTQLIGAFSRQLGATLEQVKADGHYVLRVTFALSALTAAEYRGDEDQEAPT